MSGHAGQRAIEDFVLQPLVLDAAAPAVFDGDHAINIWKIAERRAVEALCHIATDGGGAVDGGNDRDVVARAGFAGGPLVAEERAAGEWRRRRRDGLAAGIVADEIAVDEV